MSKQDTNDHDADSVESFCEKNRISRAYLYKILKQGKGPVVRKIGRRSLITREDSAAWRAALPVRKAVA